MGTGSIYLRNRPVRTAYLLDLEVLRPGTPSLASAIDGIVSYAVENWGARRDSIHFFHGSNGFTDDEWFDLENADPDRIYTFASLNQQNLERLHRLRPWSINGYVGLNPDAEPGTPMLPGVPVIPTREGLARVDAELLLFAFTYECAPITRSFLHRNFGSYRQWSDPRSPQVIRWISWLENLQREGRHLILRISHQDSVNDVFNRLAGNLQHGRVYRPPLRFIAPIEIPAALRPTGASAWTWSQGYNVFVGDSPQLFAAYWTDSRDSGFWAEPFRHRLWIPTNIFSAPGFA